MYRVNIVQEVLYGRFADVMRSLEELNEVSRARGWKEATFWVPTAGRANEVIVELVYDSLDEFAREQNEAYSDPEYMKIIRDSSKDIVQGSVRTRIYEAAPHLV